jgi:hypothetical protein
MNRERIEERLRGYFGSARAALTAALSEVNECFTSPECLSGVLAEIGHDVPAEDALVQWAIG